jgi:hypothetical protein
VFKEKERKKTDSSSSSVGIAVEDSKAASV